MFCSMSLIGFNFVYKPSRFNSDYRYLERERERVYINASIPSLLSENNLFMYSCRLLFSSYFYQLSLGSGYNFFLCYKILQSPANNAINKLTFFLRKILAIIFKFEKLRN